MIRMKDGRYMCGLVAEPHKYRMIVKPKKGFAESLAVLIGCGRGCDDLGENPTKQDEEALDAMFASLLENEQFKRQVAEAMQIVYDFG